MEEVWKPIIIEKKGVIYNFTGLYEISNLGRVRSLNHNNTGKIKIMKNQKDSRDYFQVGLSKDGERNFFLVHRLVATMFIDNPNELPQVNHKDEDKTNNHVENLEWCTQEYNNSYGTRIERIISIKYYKRYSKHYSLVYLIKPNGEKWFDKPMSQRELARQSGISYSAINKLINNGNSLKPTNRAKYDPKYIGSYVVLASEYDAQNN